jgi:hypothetical protein
MILIISIELIRRGGSGKDCSQQIVLPLRNLASILLQNIGYKSYMEWIDLNDFCLDEIAHNTRILLFLVTLQTRRNLKSG